eukprot:3693487-Rhodomonas_salina.2
MKAGGGGGGVGWSSSRRSAAYDQEVHREVQPPGHGFVDRPDRTQQSLKLAPTEFPGKSKSELLSVTATAR